MATFLKDRKDFKLAHLYENQFTIKCTCVYETEKEYYTYMGWKKKWEEYEDESRFGGLYYPSIVTLRVDLFTFLNKTYGTSYEVTDEMNAYADSFRGKLEDLYNIGIEVGWRFNEYGGFYHRYRYNTENGRSLGVVESTYGEWTKEQLIGLADAIVEFFKTDPLAIAKAAMQRQYDMYNKIGIGHREDPLYSDGATGEFIGPKGNPTICQTMLT